MASLSSRRAWIEIESQKNYEKATDVALLTESVDWNKIMDLLNEYGPRRSPHGERGLK